MLCIFDMGGVLVDNVHLIPIMAQKLQISEPEFHEICGCSAIEERGNPYSEGTIARLCRGEITADEFWELFSQKYGIPVRENYWETCFNPERIEPVYRIIEQLKKAGNTVVCGTNSIESHYCIHNKRGDYNCFDRVYASHLMGVIKPDPRFWEYILEKEKNSPPSVFFTDDNVENCAVANKLGINSHIFTSPEELEKTIYHMIE